MAINDIIENKALNIVHKKWKKILVQYLGSHIVFNGINLPSKTEVFLQRFGLPLLGFNFDIEFIPVTYISEIEIDKAKYFIIGDFSVRAPGMAFLAIKERSENIYRVNRRKREDTISWSSKYLNTSLEHFIIFLYEYCEFMNKYKEIGYASINGEEMLKEYNEMRLKLSTLDPVAMQDDSYWENTLESIGSVYGDFIP